MSWTSMNYLKKQVALYRSLSLVKVSNVGRVSQYYKNSVVSKYQGSTSIRKGQGGNPAGENSTRVSSGFLCDPKM